MKTARKTAQFLIIALISERIYHYVVTKNDSEQKHPADPSRISIYCN